MSQQAASSSTSAQAAKHAGMFDHPGSAIPVGLLLLFFAVWAMSLDVTVTESVLQGVPGTALTIAPHFSVFGQWWDVFQGTLRGIQLQTDTVSWLIEVLQFVVTCLEEILHRGANRVLRWVLWIGAGATTLLNFVANVLCNPFTNPWLQTITALVLSLGSFSLIYLSLHLIIRRGIVAAFHMVRP